MNRFKQKLRNGETVLGQMVLELFTPGIGPMLSACGLDFVIYDMEHGRCDINLVSEMIASCRGTDIVPMARVPDVDSAPLSRVLDLGARGVMVPRVETRAQMERVVAELKYAPLGNGASRLGLRMIFTAPAGRRSSKNRTTILPSSRSLRLRAHSRIWKRSSRFRDWMWRGWATTI